MSKKFVIKIIEDGPYEVYYEIPLYKEKFKIDEDGNAVDFLKQSSKNCMHSPEEKRDTINVKNYLKPPNEKAYYLCRCGHSKNKPFCDGEHECISFKGKEKAKMDSFKNLAKHYNGKYLDLLDRKDLCAVARFCDTKQNTWYEIIRGSKADAGLAVYQALNCPSGRLSVMTKKGKELENEYEKEIVILYDPKFDKKGPLAIRGGVKLISSNNKAYEVRNRYTLCRCGESKNMPFCDSSHLECKHMKGMDK